MNSICTPLACGYLECGKFAPFNLAVSFQDLMSLVNTQNVFTNCFDNAWQGHAIRQDGVLF